MLYGERGALGATPETELPAMLRTAAAHEDLLITLESEVRSLLRGSRGELGGIELVRQALEHALPRIRDVEEARQRLLA